MSIINDLYNGKIYPAEEIHPQSDNYLQLNREISELNAYLSSCLREEDTDVLNRMIKQIDESGSLENVENFRAGFYLGVRLMAEVYTGNDMPGLIS